MVDRSCQQCGRSFQAKRRSARFCSERCRKAAQRAGAIGTSLSGTGPSAIPNMPVPIKVRNPRETLDKLLAKQSLSGDLPLPALHWQQVDAVTWELRHGRKVVAHVIDRGHFADQVSWTAVCGATTIGPSLIEDCGLSNGRAGLADAKRVAEAMATGDVRPLVLFAQQFEDCTDDMRLALAGLLELILPS